MLSMTINDFWLTMAGILLGLGVILLLVGVFILVFRAINNDVNKIAVQTTKLAQKAIIEDVSGLVGNASGLVDALNQLVRTTAGIGIFLIMLGLLMMGAAYGISTTIY